MKSKSKTKRIAIQKAAKKMKQKLQVVIVLDRSGSMSSCFNDTVAAHNDFINQQCKLKSPIAITLYQFDHEYNQVYKQLPPKEVPALSKDNYSPRGSTGLFDAIGRTLSPLRYEKDKYMFVIQTDGEENASCEYTLSAVTSLIQEMKEKGHKFLFLGADVNSFNAFKAMGAQASENLNYHGEVKTSGAVMDMCVTSFSRGLEYDVNKITHTLGVKK